MNVFKRVLAAVALLPLGIMLLVCFVVFIQFLSRGVGNGYTGVRFEWFALSCIPAGFIVGLSHACRKMARAAGAVEAQAPREEPQVPLRQRPAALLGYAAICAGLAVFGFITCRKFNVLLSKRGEGATKGSLGAIRSALSIYYGDMAGVYPTDLNAITEGGKYIAKIPDVFTCGEGGPECGLPHEASHEVVIYPSVQVRDTGKWGYVNNPKDANFGTVFVDCSHTDSKGSVWAAY